MQITRDQGQTWNYVSNPYGDTTGTFPNYVYSDAPEFWSLFSQTYSTPIDIDDYAGVTIQMRYWFHSDSDAPQGEGLFLDDIAVNVDATGSSAEGDTARSRELGGLIGAAIQNELVKQKRPGGLLA